MHHGLLAPTGVFLFLFFIYSVAVAVAVAVALAIFRVAHAFLIDMHIIIHGHEFTVLIGSL